MNDIIIWSKVIKCNNQELKRQERVEKKMLIHNNTIINIIISIVNIQTNQEHRQLKEKIDKMNFNFNPGVKLHRIKCEWINY